MTLAAGACGKPEAEVKGWPRVIPLAKGLKPVPGMPDAGAAPVVEKVPERPRLADVVVALTRAPDISDSESVGPEDVAIGPSDVLEVRTWRGMTTCDRLIETACAYLGAHSQECAEIRGWRKPAPTEEVLTECQAILDQFDMTYNQRGVRRVRNPCWSLAYDVCRDFGRTSEECLEAKSEARRLRKPRLKLACKGGIILYEAKKVFPDWGPNAAPRSVRTP